MPKQQSNLDSFFGGKSQKKQKTLKSFFNKENSRNNDDETPAAEAPKKTVAVSKRRAIIDDESDEEEEQIVEQITTVDVGTKDADPSIKNDDEEPTTESKPEAETTKLEANKETTTTVVEKSSLAVTPSPPPNSTPNDTIIGTAYTNMDFDEQASSPVIRKLQAQASKFVKQAKVATNDKLGSLSSPVLYKDLVEVLEQIETISGRLEIQALLTNFVRRLLRFSPQDLYSVVYLASNSIAPAYECVELGIGDSILMKAIGDSYGTKAST